MRTAPPPIFLPFRSAVKPTIPIEDTLLIRDCQSICATCSRNREQTFNNIVLLPCICVSDVRLCIVRSLEDLTLQSFPTPSELRSWKSAVHPHYYRYSEDIR